MTNSRKVILFIATSLDGYIAKPNDDLSFLSIVEQEGEDYGYSAFLSTVDTIIIGRRTFDWVVNQIGKYPDEGMKVYIISRNKKPGNDLFTYYSGNLKELILNLKIQKGKHIFVNGGAQIVNELLKEKLIDEIIISYISILVGNGTRLFLENITEQRLKLISSKNYSNGLLQVHYKIL
jgi:dihydrofolate reductase